MGDYTHVVACRFDSIALDVAVQERVLDLLDHDHAGERMFQMEFSGVKLKMLPPAPASEPFHF